jgi:hypothetical protein
MVLYICVLIVFSLHRESLKPILVDEPLPEVVLSQRTQATQTSLARPWDTTRRGKWIIPSTRWNSRDATRSTGLGRVNLEASWIASAFSTPTKSERPRTTTDSKVSQMKYSRCPNGLIRRKSPKNPRATSTKLTRRSTTSMVAPILMS